MADFDLRPMEPADGPAIDVLMRNEAQTTAVAITTHFRQDIYKAFLAQHPSQFGVVATSPDREGLVGMATAFTDDVVVDGRVWPCAHLENLKVRDDVRRQGLGGRLAEWRIAEARRRFGGDGVVVTGVEASNSASLATARRWSTQLLGPVRVVIARVATKLPRHRDVRVRPPDAGDVEAVVAGVNAFYASYQLFPRQTKETLAAYLAPTAIGVIRQYRVVADDDGAILAGAAVTERFKVMEDHIDRVPRPLELLGRILPVFPPDRIIRTLELSLVWHAPGRLDAGRFLWDAIRFEWRDRVTHVAGQADPRGSLMDVLNVGRTIIPRVQIMVPFRGPVPVAEDRPIYLWR